MTHLTGRAGAGQNREHAAKYASAAAICAAFLSAPAAAAGETRWTFETTTDVAAHGSLYVDMSANVAPFGVLSASGARLRVTSSYSRYQVADKPDGVSRQSIEMLAGYAHVFEKATLSYGAGPVLTDRQASVRAFSSDPVVGGKAFLSTYAQPSNDMMIYAQATYMSVSNSSFAQTKFGWKFTHDLFMGPEISASSGRDYSQTRFGAHLTGVTFGVIKGSVAAGLVHDFKKGNGVFSSLTLRVEI